MLNSREQRRKAVSRGLQTNGVARPTIFYHELDNYVIGKENQDLRGDREEEDEIQRGSNRRKCLSLSELHGRHSSNCLLYPT